MEKLAGKYYIGNEKVKPVTEFLNQTLNTETVVYEVIRVISGVPLFIGEHLGRLQLSILLAGWKIIPDLKKLSSDISVLIRQNGVTSGNIKLTVVLFGKKLQTCIYFIPHSYPSEFDYRDGVEVGILHSERNNPEAKISQVNVRGKANEIIGMNNIYEVLLVDKEGFVREGSRSNVFFVKGKMILTPPENTVLNGITRQKVIQILKDGLYNFMEKQVALNDLPAFDCVFLTGTSPKVLPVKKIGNLTFNCQNQICLRIIQKYDELISEYISKNIRS
ncbi:MAG: aminotransferase class IV family protein [Prolixibacteraceae bacterium]|nr:aminotransferase class IV family protein [Prolixibacteraceae bacterium]MBN2775928.1 aminotransferase class IV family protein [Prolixibacteraceae bacterium]